LVLNEQRASSLIDKETVKKRISINEYQMSNIEVLSAKPFQQLIAFLILPVILIITNVSFLYFAYDKGVQCTGIIQACLSWHYCTGKQGLNSQQTS
jgi:hypothetical protein